MAKELICPHCKKGISPFSGYEHDERLNMLCGHCKGIVFAADKETEGKVKHLLQKVEAQTQSWQKRDCLPIRQQSSSINSFPNTPLHSGNEIYSE